MTLSQVTCLCCLVAGHTTSTSRCSKIPNTKSPWSRQKEKKPSEVRGLLGFSQRRVFPWDCTCLDVAASVPMAVCGQWVPGQGIPEKPEPVVQSHSSQQRCQPQHPWGGSWWGHTVSISGGGWGSLCPLHPIEANREVWWDWEILQYWVSAYQDSLVWVPSWVPFH